MSNDITQYQGGQMPTSPDQIADMYKAYGQAYAESERAGGATITLRNGIMSAGDQPLPGNMLAGIVLDAVHLNTYFDKPFNPQNIEPPVCYAVGRNDAEMAPHPDMQKDLAYFRPQANTCNACPLNEFGSNPTTGKGKACSNRRRLMILPAGYYEMGPQGLALQPITDPGHYKTSPFLSLTLSPTSIKGFGQWVRQSLVQYQRPMFGLISRIYLYQHPSHGKEAVGFETLAPVPPELDLTVISRHREAVQEIMEGYAPPQAQQQRGGGFYGAQHQAQAPIQGQVAAQPTQPAQQPGVGMPPSPFNQG